MYTCRTVKAGCQSQVAAGFSRFSKKCS